MLVGTQDSTAILTFFFKVEGSREGEKVRKSKNTVSLLVCPKTCTPVRAGLRSKPGNQAKSPSTCIRQKLEAGARTGARTEARYSERDTGIPTSVLITRTYAFPDKSICSKVS